MPHRFTLLLALAIFAMPSVARSEELGRVFVDGGRIPQDRRLGAPRRVSEGNNFQPFTDRIAWETRVRRLREQALVASGLWPLPQRCPLNPTITGVVDRGDYTVENVYFASYPGFYVSASLFRPRGSGPFPAVLCAHGHARYGRLELGNALMRDGKPDPDPFSFQARGAGFARLGCIALLYDMVGYADSRQLRHPTDGPKVRLREGTDDFEGLDFEMHCLSTLGLQTWNSMRAVDYLLTRPDVDGKRIAVTGASGGATQTLLLMMTDDRIAAAAPVCMVSTGFQGDCTCEQCALLKIGTDTVEYCAAFAPKPLIIVGATGDWTKEIIEKGGPEIRSSYELVGAGDRVSIVRYEAPHNYNRRSREAVYDWLNRSWQLGSVPPIQEQPFEPISKAQLEVFNEKHPRPADAIGPTELKRVLIDGAQRQLNELRPTNVKTLFQFKQTVATALSHLVASELPRPDQVAAESLGFVEQKDFRAERLLLSRKGGGEQVPAMLFVPKNAAHKATLVVHPSGKAALLDASGQPGPLLAGLLDKGQTVLAIDAFLTGEFQNSRTPTPAPDPRIGFFPCFNRTLLAQRVHDILTAVACLQAKAGVKGVNLVGIQDAGPWCLLSRGLCFVAVDRLAVDVGPASFSNVKDVTDPMYLPGALRYGDLPTLAVLSAPGDLLLASARGFDAAWLKDAYHCAGIEPGPGNLRIENEPVSAEQLVEWLTR